HKDTLILTAGAGEIGRQMIAEGRRIPLAAKESLVATVARNRQGAIRNYDTLGAGFSPHPLLMETRSEMAVPILLGDELLGVMDVRSDALNYFGEADMQTQTTLAVQIAVALQNARSFAQSQQALQELNVITRRLTREGWKSYLDTVAPVTNFVYGELPETTTADGNSTEATTLDLPLTVQGEDIGQITMAVPTTVLDETAEVIDAVTDRLGRHIENLRLTEQTEAALAQTEEQSRRLTHLNEMGNELGAADDLNEALTAVTMYMGDIIIHDHLSLTLLEPDGDSLKVFALDGKSGAMPVGEELPVAGTAMGTAITQRQLVNLPDIRQSKYLENEDLVKQGLRATLVAPLITSRGSLGTLSASANVVNAFDAQDENLIWQIASLLASTLESHRLFQQAQKRAAELETVARVSTAASTILETNNLLQSVADLTKISFDLYHAHIYRLDESTNTLVLAAGAGDLGRKMTDETWIIPLDRQQSLVARAARERQGIIVNDVLADPDYLPNPLLLETRSETAVPMVVGDQLLGILDLQSAEPHYFTEEDVRIYTTLAAQVAVALQNAHQYEQTQTALAETKRQAQRLSLLNRVSERISLADSLDEIYEITAVEAAQIFPADRVSLSLLNEAGDQAQIIALEGESGSVPVGEPQPIAGSPTEKAVRARKTIIMNDREPDHTRAINSAMIVPLTIGGEVIGTINVGSKQANLYDDQDENLVFQLTSLLSAAVDNQRLYDEQSSTVEELRRLDHLRSTFLANMSHELRTPLNSVIGFTDVILEGLDGPLTDMMEDDLKIIRKNGHHLLHLIGDVLDMAKIEAGRMDIVSERLNLLDVMKDVLDITSPLAREKNLDLQLLNDSLNVLEIEGDSSRLKQVFLNLIGNAIKFTEKGGVTIEVTRAESTVQIGVHDTGAGIPSDQMEYIFEAFRQADNSATRKVGGTGLGLPISRQLIELHNGRIWVESNGVPGEGSSFFIELPLGNKMLSTVDTGLLSS
ncbi:MAG: GAF domain-containing protein, partial [Chloroflexi bacterium]|nr:GAF domain-containing protein [Chloroflexota bacterium]